jgi:ketosteroid isomerase-like protein
LEEIMKYKSLLAVAGLLALTLFTGRAQDTEQAKVERYIKEGESQWAEADSKGDTAAVERVLADDFVGVAPDGTFYDKAEEIKNTREDNGNTLFNHANEIKVRFFGDTAVAQGSETWERRTGEPKKGSYIWTDTWVKRNGKWQIVAAEDLLAPEKATKSHW